MGMTPMSQAPNWEEAMRAANMNGHATYIDSQQWIGDPNMSMLGLEDAHYGMPGLGVGDPTGQNAAQAFQQIVQTGLQTWQQIEAQKQANKQAALAARQGKNPQGGSMTQGGSGMSPDLTKWLLIIGVVVVVGMILMSIMKKKRGSGSGGGEHHTEHEHTVIDKEIGI